MENIYILSWNNTESQQNRQAHCGCISLKKRQRIKLLIAIQHETICHWQNKASASFSPMLTTEYTASSTVPLLQLSVLRVKVLSQKRPDQPSSTHSHKSTAALSKNEMPGIQRQSFVSLSGGGAHHEQKAVHNTTSHPAASHHPTLSLIYLKKKKKEQRLIL